VLGKRNNAFEPEGGGGQSGDEWISEPLLPLSSIASKKSQSNGTRNLEWREADKEAMFEKDIRNLLKRMRISFVYNGRAGS
jgi:hypothetical protein